MTTPEVNHCDAMDRTPDPTDERRAQLAALMPEAFTEGNSDHVQPGMLRPIEDLRIECGKRHFKNFEEVQFRVVNSLNALLA